MGVDKATMNVGGEPAALRLCRILDEANFDEVVLVGGDPDRFSGSGRVHLTDLVPGRGPLEGIRTALAAAPCEWTLVIAVDLVAIDRSSVLSMVDALRDRPFDDVIHATSPDGPQPLFGWWRRAALQTIERELSLDRRSLRNVVDLLHISTVEMPTEYMLNANRPEDLG